MARGPEDLLTIDLELACELSLDMERIEADPVYRQCLEMEEHPEVALQVYIEHYITRERLLSQMPSTNGPGRLVLKEWTRKFNAT